jgi:hypothetical protein
LRHSGFTTSAGIPAEPLKTDDALLVHHPLGGRPLHFLSRKKISIKKNGEATVISSTSDNEFFKGKTESFSVIRFLLELAYLKTLRQVKYFLFPYLL